MYLKNDSLKIVEINGGYFVEFKVVAEYLNIVSMELRDPINVGGDYWNINLFHNGSKHTTELIHSDLTKTFNGTWSVTILALDAKNNVIHSRNSLNEKICFKIDYNSIISTTILSPIFVFEVKIVIFPKIQENLKEAKIDGVLSDLYRNYEDISRTSDIMIIAGDHNSESILVHKNILTLRSPVFKAMFDSNMTESSSNQIQISDFDETSIRRMVEFLYKDTFTDIDGTYYEDFISLLALANKYQINSLKEASSRYLSKMITLDNIADMRNKANLYDSATLLNNCLQFIESNSTKLFKDDIFLSSCNTSTL